MEHSFLFLISSAINHFDSREPSRFTIEDRFLQTIETIETIRSKVPNCKICLFELSQNPISEKYKNEIDGKVDLFLDYHNDLDIKILYQNFTNHKELFKYGKSLLELKGMLLTLTLIGSRNLFANTTRVFKISGRYVLNDFFDITDYQTKFLKNKYVTKHYKFSDHEPDSNVHYHVFQNKGSMVTALWSFDSTLFYKTVESIEKSFLYLQNMLQYTPGNDIEHALYHFIDKENLINCDRLGVSIKKGMEEDDYDE